MTNGLRLYQEPSVIDLLKKYGINTVYMSYHFGIQDVINSIPSLIVEEVIKRLKAADFNIYLNCTLTNKNYKDIAQYAHQAYVMGAKGIGFNKIFQQGKATDISELDMNNLQLLEFFKVLTRLEVNMIQMNFILLEVVHLDMIYLLVKIISNVMQVIIIL